MPNLPRKLKSVAGRERIAPASNSRAEKLTPATLNRGSHPSDDEGPPFSLKSSKPLSRAFFDRDPRTVARELLGKFSSAAMASTFSPDASSRPKPTSAPTIPPPTPPPDAPSECRPFPPATPTSTSSTKLLTVSTSLAPRRRCRWRLISRPRAPGPLADMARFRHLEVAHATTSAQLKSLTSCGRLAQAFAITPTPRQRQRHYFAPKVRTSHCGG